MRTRRIGLWQSTSSRIILPCIHPPLFISWPLRAIQANQNLMSPRADHEVEMMSSGVLSNPPSHAGPGLAPSQLWDTPVQSRSGYIDHRCGLLLSAAKCTYTRGKRPLSWLTSTILIALDSTGADQGDAKQVVILASCTRSTKLHPRSCWGKQPSLSTRHHGLRCTVDPDFGFKDSKRTPNNAFYSLLASK
jgi:hypothetical protein